MHIASINISDILSYSRFTKVYSISLKKQAAYTRLL